MSGWELHLLGSVRGQAAEAEKAGGAEGRKVNIHGRADNFMREFPKSHVAVVNGKLSGMWIVGNTYRGAYSAGYYGAYPHSYLARVKALFPDLKPFHLFSGLVEGEWTLDRNPDVPAKILGDAHRLPVRSGCLSLIVADPPYSSQDAQRYGIPYISKPKVFRECWRVLRFGGFLVWLDLIYPQFRFKDWFNFSLYGAIGVIVSTQHRIRLCTILQKREIAKKRVQAARANVLLERKSQLEMGL